MLQPLQAQVVSASTGSGCFSLKLFQPLQAQVASASAGSSYISLCRLKLLQAFVQEEILRRIKLRWSAHAQMGLRIAACHNGIVTLCGVGSYIQ